MRHTKRSRPTVIAEKYTFTKAFQKHATWRPKRATCLWMANCTALQRRCEIPRFAWSTDCFSVESASGEPVMFCAPNLGTAFNSSVSLSAQRSWGKAMPGLRRLQLRKAWGLMIFTTYCCCCGCFVWRSSLELKWLEAATQTFQSEQIQVSKVCYSQCIDLLW